MWHSSCNDIEQSVFYKNNTQPADSGNLSDYYYLEDLWSESKYALA